MFGVITLIWVKGRQIAWTHILLLLLGTSWALMYARTVTLGAAIAAPLLAAALHSLLPRHTPRITQPEVAALAGGVVACMVAVTLVLPGSTGTPANVPNGLNVALDRLPPHTVIFNDYALGGWLLWRHPTLEPVIDGRAVPFPKAQFDGYLKTFQVGAGWETFLATTSSTYALVAEDSPLATALDERLRWRSLGRDDGYVLLHARSTDS